MFVYDFCYSFIVLTNGLNFDDSNYCTRNKLRSPRSFPSTSVCRLPNVVSSSSHSHFCLSLNLMKFFCFLPTIEINWNNSRLPSIVTRSVRIINYQFAIGRKEEESIKEFSSHISNFFKAKTPNKLL